MIKDFNKNKTLKKQIIEQRKEAVSILYKLDILGLISKETNNIEFEMINDDITYERNYNDGKDDVDKLDLAYESLDNYLIEKKENNVSIKIYVDDKNNYENYTFEIVKGVLNNISSIDSLITKSLENYTINRLNYVDRAIIRVATYEMIEGLDRKIVINEAVNITKELSNLEDDKQKTFNNSVLDKISKAI